VIASIPTSAFFVFPDVSGDRLSVQGVRPAAPVDRRLASSAVCQAALEAFEVALAGYSGVCALDLVPMMLFRT